MLIDKKIDIELGVVNGVEQADERTFGTAYLQILDGNE